VENFLLPSTPPDRAKTRISYLYRDAVNYKAFGTVVLGGRLTPEQVLGMAAKMADGDGSIPSKEGLDDLRQRLGDRNEDDHHRHEIDRISHAMSGADGEMGVEEFLRCWKEAPDGRDAGRHETEHGGDRGP
jgi:hypothetical protein